MNAHAATSDSDAKLGQVFRCMVCGAETTVIRASRGSGPLRPVCCNQPMALLNKRNEMYRCPVCGSEVAVINPQSNNLRLICCNVPMRLLVKGTVANP